MNKIKYYTFAVAMMVYGSTWAAVSPEEADRLKSVLTPFGAERAGNAEGTIPAWTGGFTTDDGYKSGQRPDPFSGEEPLYIIDASNMEKYRDQLNDGQIAMLEKFSTYKMEVYPSHRTASAPQWVYDNTFHNATRATTMSDGNSVEGAYGGIPFPIPATGNEAMWNHLLRWQGESALFQPGTWIVSGGSPVLGTATRNEERFPYYYKDGSLESFDGEYWSNLQVVTSPAFKAGESLMVRDSFDVAVPRQAWQYLVGQRRVRRAPNLAYDTPNPSTSGVDFLDEVMVFGGALDHFDWELVGKKEIFIPYNLNGFMNKEVNEVLGPDHVEHLRWELHRVWVVEATLAEGKRNTIPKRRFYLDEDTWGATLYDGWDAQGQLWKTSMALPIVAPEFPVVAYHYFTTMDLLKGTYQATIANEQPTQYRMMPPYPSSNFTPESMAARGVR